MPLPGELPAMSMVTTLDNEVERVKRLVAPGSMFGGGPPEEVAKGSIREHGSLTRLRLDPDKLEKWRAEIDVIEQLMLHGNDLAVVRLFCTLKALVEARQAEACFESPLLVSYFVHKLEMVKKSSIQNGDWFGKLCAAHENGEPLKKALAEHGDYVDETLRLSANSMVWLARERAVIDSVLRQQSAVRLKVLAGLVTGAMWLLTGLTAYMAPADSDCVSVCALDTTA